MINKFTERSRSKQEHKQERFDYAQRSVFLNIQNKKR